MVDEKFDLLSLDRKDGEWTAIEQAPAFLAQYTTYGTPFSKIPSA
jgi:hypothetical protein